VLVAEFVDEDGLSRPGIQAGGPGIWSQAWFSRGLRRSAVGWLSSFWLCSSDGRCVATGGRSSGFKAALSVLRLETARLWPMWPVHMQHDTSETLGW